MSLNTAFVQLTEGSSDSSSTTIASASANVTAGNLQVAAVRFEGGGVSDTATVTFADTAGGTWATHSYKSIGSGSEDERIAVGYCLSSSAHATNVVTATISASRAYRRIKVCEYSYDNTIQISATDGEGASSSNGTTITTDTSLSAVAGDVSFIVVGWYNNGRSFTSDASFTDRGTSNTLLQISDDIGAYTSAPGGTFSGADTYVALAFSFEESSGGASTSDVNYTGANRGIARGVMRGVG